MAHINLLPWREERRQQRHRQFLVTLVLAIVLTGGVIYWVHSLVQGAIDYQQARNRLLQTQISKMDKQIAEIRDLRQTKQQLLARMKIIEQLQQKRSDVVHLFDQLVQTIPSGVYLDSLHQTGSEVRLKGMAESNAEVSTYMKKLNASAWFADPQLTVIETKKAQGIRLSSFSLRVRQTSPGSQKKGKS